MIETVVALLMFVNGEIKEHLVQPKGMAQCLRGKRHAERQFSESVSYNCLLYTSPSPRDLSTSRMPSSA